MAPLAREFVGPVDPHDIPTITLVFGDRWTPSGAGPVPGSVSSNVGSSFEIHQDPVTGWETRPTGYAGGTWIGWSDPTGAGYISELDRFIPIPDPT